MSGRGLGTRPLPPACSRAAARGGIIAAAGLKARKYGVAGLVSARNRTAYMGSFLGDILSYSLFVFVFSRVWTAALADRIDIEGYSLSQLIWYFIAAEIPAFGFGRFFWTLAQDMKSGQVAYLASRPFSFVGYHFAQGMGKAAVDASVLAAVGAGLGLLLAGPLPISSPAHAAAALASILIAGSMQFLLQFAIAMTAFWIEDNSAFFWIYQKLVLIVGTLLPIEFLPEAARRIAAWTPFPSMSYAPARIVSSWPGGGAALSLIASQLAWLAAAVLLCQAAYRLGRSRLTVNGG